MTLRRLVARANSNERGATAVIVAVCMVFMVGGAAFAVDLGNAWQRQRQLHTATDAAALAAAQDYALGANGCTSTAGSYVAQNDSQAALTGCSEASTGGSSGYVTVAASSAVKFAFAGVFGIRGADVHSSTTAAFGTPKGITGLRPMALCLNSEPELTSWLNLPHGPTGPSTTIRILYSKSQPDACGANAPGNWGMMDFNGGANSNAETKDWVLNGYQHEVTLSPPNIAGDTGAFSNSISSELSTLINKEFQLPVFDQVSGNGANAQFRIVAFVTVKLIAFKTTGSEASRYLDLQFQTRVAEGQCCSNGLNAGTRVVDICAVTANFDANNCKPS
jgi:Flp pilus assembly protein TadG